MPSFSISSLNTGFSPSLHMPASLPSYEDRQPLSVPLIGHISNTAFADSRAELKEAPPPRHPLFVIPLFSPGFELRESILMFFFLLPMDKSHKSSCLFYGTMINCTLSSSYDQQHNSLPPNSELDSQEFPGSSDRPICHICTGVFTHVC